MPQMDLKNLINTGIAEQIKSSKRAVPISQYSGLRQTVKNSAPTFGTSGIFDVSSLGSVTTKPGGSTKFESFHPGVDIANKIGTKISAFTGGTVKEVVTGKKQGEKGYGNYIIVVDDNGNRHRYSHLYNTFVRAGQRITPGSAIGTMGNTGSTYSTSGGTGSHLDYRVTNAYNKYVNPYRFIKTA